VFINIYAPNLGPDRL